MKKSNILLVIVIVALQGFFACKSEDISPHTTLQKSNARIRNLIETNHWYEVAKPKDNFNIFFLNDVENATHFFEKIKKSDLHRFGSSKLRPIKNDIVLAHGVFTFLNGEKANINFETSMDAEGEIMSIKLDEHEVSYIQNKDYVEIQKWGIVALPMDKEEVNELGTYQYYYVPVVIYKAFLENNGWSSVQFLNALEQANFEGEGGIWEPFYLNRNPSIPPTIAPWIPKHFSI